MNNIFKISLLFIICLYLCVLEVNAKEDIYQIINDYKIIYVVEDNGYLSHTWQFNRENYRDGIDFSLKLLSSSENKEIIDNYIDSNSKNKYLFFEHHGILPTTAMLKVNVGDMFNDGEKVYLYYFNDETKKMEYMNNNLVVKNGFVSFKLKHCSDYVLTSSLIKSSTNNPSSLTPTVIFLFTLGFCLMGVTLFTNFKDK